MMVCMLAFGGLSTNDDLAKDSGRRLMLASCQQLVLGSLFLCFLCLFIISRQLEGTKDLLDEVDKFTWRLKGDSFNISLEDEEILCFDKNVMGDERGIAGGIRHSPIVEMVLRCTCGRNTTRR